MNMNKSTYKESLIQMLKNYKPNYIEYVKKRYENKKICVWGVGNMGIVWPEVFESIGMKVDCYCDNDSNKVGKNAYGTDIKCISLDELTKIKNDVAVVIPTRFYKQIYAQLSELNFPMVDRIFHQKFMIDEYMKNHNIDEIIDNLCKVLDILEDEESCRILCKLVSMWTKDLYEYGYFDDIYSQPQYFPKDIVKPNDQEIYVDCGAYNGDNIPDFMEFENKKFKSYYAFELNKSNTDELLKNIENNWSELKQQFVVENKGVSDITQEIYYSDKCEGSKVDNQGTIKGQVVSLDDYFGEKDVTFIKMDIEGMEIPALKGGKKLIERCYPTLAICMYHKETDYWKIPMFIKKNWPDYKIYIRHHTDLMNETVCYAVKK